MTLDINKGIICDLLQCKSLGQVEQAVARKFTEEASVLRARIESQQKELDEAQARVLVLQ